MQTAPRFLLATDMRHGDTQAPSGVTGNKRAGREHKHRRMVEGAAGSPPNIGLLLGNYGSEDFSVTNKLVRPGETRLHGNKQKHESLKLIFKCDPRSFPESDPLLLRLCGQTCHVD